MCDLSDPISEAKQNVFIENVKRYNVMVDDLTKCLLKQTDLFTSIQHEFKHIKDSLTTRDTAHNSYVRLKKSIKLLRNYCEQFSNEQMNIITDIADRQTLIDDTICALEEVVSVLKDELTFINKTRSPLWPF
ncbi:hypothetical protein X777_04310 [Ooceraea biroi]|uniref:Uncharacterized protein n=1 Tax=Ooceraea biroi TaxID=2015173 RepID=A0A026VS86_OOCBI|nr:hypothetical protein X777_04310 [Ooceraea biroi]